MYCWVSLGPDPDGWTDENGKVWPALKIKMCPYHRIIPGQPEQANGYCDYLEAGDYDGTTMLLWDSCKECNVNMDWQDE